MRTDPGSSPARAARPRLLFLSYFFPPVRVMACVRTWNMARSLARRGWDVTVVTPDAAVWDRTDEVAETENALAREGIRCVRTRHPWAFLSPRHTRPFQGKRGRLADLIRAHAAHLARQTALYLNVPAEVGWLLEARRACSHLRPGEVDVVLATGSPYGTFSLARALSRRLGCAYVLDYRDLWSGYPHPAGRRYIREPTLERETGLLRESARVLAVSNGTAECLQGRFRLGTKLEVVSNAYDAESLSGVVPHEFEHFAIVYAGHFHPPKRVITPLMAALSSLDRDATVPHWAFHYYGRHPAHVRGEAIRFGLANRVIIHGEVPRPEALAVVAGAGIAVVITTIEADGSSAEKGVLTGKVFEAIGLKTPLLVIAPPGSDLEGVLEVAGLGRRFAGTEVGKITAFLSDAIAGRTPPPLHPEAFDWEHVGERLDHILRDVLREHPAGSNVRAEPGGRGEAASLRP